MSFPAAGIYLNVAGVSGLAPTSDLGTGAMVISTPLVMYYTAGGVPY